MRYRERRKVTPEEIEARTSLVIFIPMFSIFLLLSATSIHFLSFDIPVDSKLLALLNLAINLPFLYFFGRELLTRKPRLILNNLGITDYRFGFGTIYWSEVAQLRLITLRGSHTMQLTLNAQPRLSRFWRFLTKLRGDNAIYLPISGLSIDPIEIYKFAIGKAPGGWT